MYFQGTRLQISLATALFAVATGCTATVDDSGLSAEEQQELDPGARARVGDSRFAAWRAERVKRQAELDAYLAANSTAFDSFIHRPVGVGGVPTPLLTGFGQALPDLWGDAHLSRIGMFADPFKTDNPLPLGMGSVVAPNGVPLTTLACGGCHTGHVTGPDGKDITLVGAPSTTFNQFRATLEKTVNDPRYFAIFGTNALTQGFHDKVVQNRSVLDATLGSYAYNPLRVANAPSFNEEKPGNLDPFSIAVTPLTLPELLNPATAAQIIAAIMPPLPPPTDLMSVWRQKDRPLAQWDGSIPSAVYRNLGAALGVVGDPAVVDFQNAASAATFTRDLPPPPYPFDVDNALADAGERLYDRFCGGCHAPGNKEIYPVSATRTDPNRLLVYTPENRRRLTLALRAACKDPAQCNIADDQILRDVDATGRGYQALPLDGIWARAPYLHNGSVPTLFNLLVPSTRPKTFLRGNVKYDQLRVGFVFDQADARTQVYDTSKAGSSNSGHDTAAFNGIDWGRNPIALAALLEYMKTL
jgi:hypothetical protein